MGLKISEETLNQILSLITERQRFLWSTQNNFVPRSVLFPEIYRSIKEYLAGKTSLEILITELEEFKYKGNYGFNLTRLFSTNGFLVLNWLNDWVKDNRNYEDRLCHSMNCWMHHFDDAAYMIGDLLRLIHSETRIESDFPGIHNSFLYTLSKMWDLQVPNEFPVYFDAVVKGLEYYGLFTPDKHDLVSDYYNYGITLTDLLYSIYVRTGNYLRYSDLQNVLWFQ